MLFSTPEFAVFFLVCFGVYYLPFLRKFQIHWLVVASFFFYSYEDPILLILLAISILINAVTSYKVAYSPSHQKRLWGIWGVVVNLGVLAFFKYAGLLGSALGDLFSVAQSDPIQFLMRIPLPIGISFYTFEGISLLADTWAKPLKNPEDEHDYVPRSFFDHLRNTSLFVAFFPHLIAGPILKARHFLPQISEKHFKDIPWQYVFRTLIIGYFLKMVIADNLKDHTAWIAFPYYQTLSLSTGVVLLFGYSMQIFADFAGYSLIALGLAAMYGYELAQNFNYPYISKSIAEFWRRWHISLSTWLRDYLYFPLGGNRKGQVRTYFNLFIVMVLGGLWHGAAWSYAVWGAYHGLGLAIERLVLRDPDRETGIFVSGLRMVFVFTFVTLGWLLFKLPNFNEAVDFLRSIVANKGLRPDLAVIAPVMLFSLPVIGYHVLSMKGVLLWRSRATEQPSHAWNRLEPVILAALLVLLFLNYGTSTAFIYFQF